jgi:hypothetical protein
MPTWSDVVLAVSTKATKSDPPVQWVYAVVLLIVSMIVGIILSREMDRVSLEKAQLEISKNQLADMRARAATETKIDEAARLAGLAKSMEQAVADQEIAVGQLERELKGHVAAVERAKNWKELQDA